MPNGMNGQFQKGDIPWNKGIPCTEEQKKKMSKDMKKRYRQDLEYRENKSNDIKKIWADPDSIYNSDEYRQKLSIARKGRKLSQETKDKISEANKGKIGNNLGKRFSEEHRRKISEGNRGKVGSMLGKQHSEETKKKMSIAAIKRCKENMTYWENLHKSLQLKPNKPEKALDKILQKLLPGEYKYVGDLSFILGGKNPDFMNVNGKKKLLEIYGDYWHKGENPQDKIDFFKGYGFDTLVIWENELKNKDKLKTKLEKFHY